MLHRAMLNWAALFLLIGLMAGAVAFTGASSGVWTFLLVTAFVVLLAVGALPFVAGPGDPRGNTIPRGKMT